MSIKEEAAAAGTEARSSREEKSTTQSNLLSVILSGDFELQEKYAAGSSLNITDSNKRIKPVVFLGLSGLGRRSRTETLKVCNFKTM